MHPLHVRFIIIIVIIIIIITLLNYILCVPKSRFSIAIIFYLMWILAWSKWKAPDPTASFSGSRDDLEECKVKDGEMYTGEEEPQDTYLDIIEPASPEDVS